MSIYKELFAGSDYIPARDDVRLKGQIERVFKALQSGEKRTLGQISAITGDPESSVSAQLRHLRKPQHGGYRIEKEFVSNGLYLYWMLPPLTTGQQELL